MPTKTKLKSQPKLAPRRSTRQRTSGERAISKLSDALIERAKKDSQSKQPRFQDKNDPQGMFSSVYSWLKRAELCEPEYKSDSRKRDQWLREFWHHESHLAGVANAVTVIDKNRGFTLTGGRNQVHRFLPVFHAATAAPGLRGWRPFLASQSLSYWSTDMGVVTELETDGEGGPLVNLYHVDSARCMLTGRYSSPLQYYPTKGGLQNWKDVDFFRTVSMPSDDEKMNGLGFCAVSRCLEMAKIMCAVTSHDLEMLGAKMPKGLLMLRGISQNQWDTAMSAREDKLKELEREYFAGVFVLASSGLDDVDAKLVALSSLPAGFDMEVFTNQLMYGYALCFGYDPTEFWPVNAGVMGRGKETDIQHRKATGKGGLDFALGFQEGLQNRLPDSILFEFEQRDSEGELLEAQVQSAWVEIATKLYESGLKDGAPLLAPTNDEARQRALQILVESGSTLISEDWVVNEKKVIVDDSDTNEVRQLRERMVEDPHVLRAIQKYPDEPIVRYEYGTDASGLPRQRMKTLWPVAYEAFKKRVYLAAVVRSVKSTLDDYAITVHTLGNLLITDGGMTRDGYEESLRHVSRAAAVYSFLKGKYPKRGEMSADEANMLDAAEYVLGLLPGELAEADERDGSGALFRDEILREMLGDGWDVLSNLLGLNDESLVSFADAIENGEYDQDEQALIDRADMWADAAQGMYHAGHLYRAGNPKYRWDYQPGKVHCGTCSTLNGQVKTAEEFRALGYYPQSPNLECSGIHCGCELTEVS